MEIRVHRRHQQIPPSLREHATHKLGQLEKFLSTITSIDVELFTDGQPKHGKGQVVHVTVITPGPVFRTKVVADDLKSGVEVAATRLERQIKEFKRKRSGKPYHLNRTKRAVESTEHEASPLD